MWSVISSCNVLYASGESLCSCVYSCCVVLCLVCVYISHMYMPSVPSGIYHVLQKTSKKNNFELANWWFENNRQHSHFYYRFKLKWALFWCLLVVRCPWYVLEQCLLVFILSWKHFMYIGNKNHRKHPGGTLGMPFSAYLIGSFTVEMCLNSSFSLKCPKRGAISITCIMPLGQLNLS